MINYSTCMRGNPTDKDAAKKAYANAQYSQVMTLDKFCYHIASHGCVYSRADIQAILILAVDCLREQLLNGQQIQMGDLGVFSNSIRSLGAHSMAEFTVENITEVNVLWAPGRPFQQPAPRCRIPTGSHTQGSRRSSEGIEGRKDYGRPDRQFFCRRHCR